MLHVFSIFSHRLICHDHDQAYNRLLCLLFSKNHIWWHDTLTDVSITITSYTQDLSTSVLAVMSLLQLDQVIILGVGAGANIAARVALAAPNKVIYVSLNIRVWWYFLGVGIDICSANFGELRNDGHSEAQVSCGGPEVRPQSRLWPLHPPAQPGSPGWPALAADTQPGQHIQIWAPWRHQPQESPTLPRVFHDEEWSNRQNKETQVVVYMYIHQVSYLHLFVFPTQMWYPDPHWSPLRPCQAFRQHPPSSHREEIIQGKLHQGLWCGSRVAGGPWEGLGGHAAVPPGPGPGARCDGRGQAPRGQQGSLHEWGRYPQPEWSIGYF